MRRRVVWLLPIAFGLACSSSTEPMTLSAQLHVSPDRPGAAISCTLVNNTADTLYAAACCARAVFSVERRVGSRWGSYAGGVCLDICPRDAQPVPPYDSITGSVAVFDPGTFRLSVDVARTWRGDSPAAIKSDAFTVR